MKIFINGVRGHYKKKLLEIKLLRKSNRLYHGLVVGYLQKRDTPEILALLEELKTMIKNK